MAVDESVLNDFLGKFVADLGATANAGMVVIGHRLGLYRAMAGAGPLTAAQVAERTGTAQRYVTEWLAAQAASGYVAYHEPGLFSLTEEQAFALADPDGPLYLPGAFVLALASLKAERRISEAFRTGAGLAWHDQDNEVFDGCEQFFAPGYRANLVQSWIPALDGAEAKLRAGAKVADVGCGHGASTRIMANAFPASTFTGYDYHTRSIEQASKAAAAGGLADRVRFAVASATDFPGADYDLVATFDCLHDMGHPVAAARHIRGCLAPDGAWLIVEPAAGDDLSGNLNPVGRIYYAFSTLLCVPNALAQHPAVVLGNQAGQARIRDVVTQAGFTRFRRAAQTPFNIVLEARP
ncbi:MAG TPA: class I SAM-dependent methyltransferase [Streptosporangiaceae bacterium]|nr:class I SAM-dependent methyltransferase [Streptosporangiaceae bacterium]